METKEIRHNFIKRSRNIPDFIDTKSEVDVYIFDNLSILLDIYISLITDKFITQDKIDNLSVETNLRMDSIFAVLDTKGKSKTTNNTKFILVSDLLLKFVIDLKRTLLEQEKYEALNNVKLLCDIFYVNVK